MNALVGRSKFFSATTMPDRDWWQVLWRDPEGMLRAIGIKPEMTVLDLCCGDGYFTAPLAVLVHGKVFGLDIDSDCWTRRERRWRGKARR
jgi:predicted methyltransferase